jgi:uncharacterized protein YukE
MGRDLAKEAGALESAAGKIRAAADQLDALKRQASSQVAATQWLGSSAQAAQAVAADIEAALSRHTANMRSAAGKVSQASVRHDAADAQGGQLVTKVGGLLKL